MKKMLSLILVLTMIVSICITASAAETNYGTAGTNITVTGTYATGAAATDKINVDISWGAMSFTYTPGEASWNPDNHTTTVAAGSWTASGNNIDVTNHSNVAVSAGLTFDSEISGIEGKFYDAATGGSEVTSIELDAPAEDSAQDSSKGTAYLQITSGSIAKDETLGTITVTITADSDSASAMKYQVGESVTIDGTAYYVLEANAQTALLITKETKSGLVSVLTDVKLPTEGNYIAAYEADILDDDVVYVVGNSDGSPAYISADSVMEGIKFNSEDYEIQEIAVDNNYIVVKYHACLSVSNAAA